MRGVKCVCPMLKPARPILCPLQPKEIGLPFTAYYAIDEVREVGFATVLVRPWQQVPFGNVAMCVAIPTALFHPRRQLPFANAAMCYQV